MPVSEEEDPPGEDLSWLPCHVDLPVRRVIGTVPAHKPEKEAGPPYDEMGNAEDGWGVTGKREGET